MSALRRRRLAWIIAAAVVFSGSACTASDRSLSHEGNPGAATASANLRSTLVARWGERAFFEARLVSAALAGDEPAFAAAREELMTSSAETARLFAPSVGESPANRLDSHLAKRANLAAAYARELAAGGGDTSARVAFDENAQPTADVFAAIEEWGARHVLVSLLEDQARRMSEEASAIRRGDAPLDAEAAHLVDGTEIADLLALAVQRAYPGIYPDSSDLPAATARSTMVAAFSDSIFLAYAYSDAVPELPRRSSGAAIPVLDAAIGRVARSVAAAGGATDGSLPQTGFAEAWSQEVSSMVDFASGDLGRGGSGGDLLALEASGARVVSTLVAQGADETAARDSLSTLGQAWRDSIISVSAGRVEAAYSSLKSAISAVEELALAVAEAGVRTGG